MKNPFVYGKEVSGANFCNRKKEIEELRRQAHNSQNVIIFSQRRFGKTSLVKEVERRVKKEGLVTVYADIYSALNEEEFVKIYARAISESLLGKVEKALNNAKAIFKRIRPKITVGDDGKPAFAIDLEKGDMAGYMEEVLESVNKYLKAKKKKGLVIFDEFQQIGQFKTDRAEKVLRTHIQTHANIAYFFMGSKKHLINDMFTSPNRPFYKSAAPYPVEKIAREELMIFIKRKFTETGKKITDEIAGRIIDTCESHPYYVQFLCNVVWDNTAENGAATGSGVDGSIKLMIERGAYTYESIWSDLTANQRQLLVALAKSEGGEKIYSSDYIGKYNLVSQSSLHRVVNSLIDKDLIDKSMEKYTIVDIMFKQWLRKL